MSTRETSREAARSVKGAVAQLRNRVLAAISDAGPGGRTCDEVEAKLKMKHQTISALVNELMEKGLIVDSKIRRSNKRHAVVWVAAPLNQSTAESVAPPKRSPAPSEQVIVTGDCKRFRKTAATGRAG